MRLLCLLLILFVAGATEHESPKLLGKSIAGEDRAVSVLAVTESFDILLGRSGKRLADIEASSHSDCWTSAWTTLEQSCDSLEDEQRKQLALKLASCHLKEAGFGGIACAETETAIDSRQCLHHLLRHDPTAYQCYTEYFLNSLSLCSLIEAGQLKKSVALTVDRLLHSAVRTGSVLTDYEQQSAESIDQFRFYEKTFGEMFEQLSWIQGRMETFEQFLLAVTQHIASFQAAGFYLLLAFFAYLASSTKRTAAARSWLWLGLTAALALELWGPACLLDGVDSALFKWLLRRALVAFSLVAVAATALRYKNLDWENHLLLRQLVKEVEDSRAHLYAPAQVVEMPKKRY